MILQFNDLFQLLIVVNFKLIRNRSFKINLTVICLSTLSIFFSMKHMSFDKIPTVALHISFKTQT